MLNVFYYLVAKILILLQLDSVDITRNNYPIYWYANL